MGQLSLTFRRVSFSEPDFSPLLARLQDRGEADFAKVEPAVREILETVKTRGDAAVLDYIAKFERRKPRELFSRTRIREEGKRALENLEPNARAAMEVAAERIADFHRKEREAMFAQRDGVWGFRFEDQDGASLGLRIRALDRVGVYAPGGKARYPSSVLMSAIPASVAGVEEIILATPLSGVEEEDRSLLAAAHLAGVTSIVDAGGAQAIAALAYGTASIPRVDKIVGPGNAYVACAKRLIYGAVAIDSIAGPSEILVVADRSARARDVAADLLSQAEHDEEAYAILVTTEAALVDDVEVELSKQLADLPRQAIASASLAAHGAALIVADRSALASVASAIAPEHLSLQVDEPEALLEGIKNVGAAFIGGQTPEAAGDYLAGPSHVLPTGGAVRFGSPLGVHDFVARTSMIRYTARALRRDEAHICAFARLEGLEAHARAVLSRTRD